MDGMTSMYTCLQSLNVQIIQVLRLDELQTKERFCETLVLLK
jgi:hypothetical protein